MTGQPVLNPRKEKRERKAVRGGREKMTKRESEREKWGGGEREREEDCLFSAPGSHAQIIVNAAGKKKKSPGWA